jgi:hypothetical protein
MTDLFKRISSFVQNLAVGPLLQPKAIIITPGRCSPPGSSGADIQRDRAFGLTRVATAFLRDVFLARACTFASVFAMVRFLSYGLVTPLSVRIPGRLIRHPTTRFARPLL